VSEKHSPAAGEDQSATAERQRPPAVEKQRLAAVSEKHSPAAGEDQSATAQKQRPPASDQQRLAAVSEDRSPAAGEKQGLAVTASVDPADPDADRMVFRIELSRPAEQTVVLIYGTVEGTAKAGEDFEPQQGVMTLAPGTKSAEVHVPLVEQPSSTGEKRFELFLTADPKVAEVVDRRITATINGAD
jgi:Calx-beta domain